MKKPELLAPVGSFEKAKTAFKYGADAIYVGTSNLSLRTRVDMNDDELAKIIEYAHSINKKVWTFTLDDNEILKRETEISKRSFDNFLLTIFPHEVKDANIIYGEKNKYLELIEEKFSSKKSISYGIKIRKDFARAGLIQISKPKVLRLLNEHLYEKHEITKDIVKQCMLYNLITTDEILNELDRILTEEFELLDQKIKKY